MELITIKNTPKEFRIRLLQALGYDVDREGVFVTKDGKPVIDRYIGKPVRVDNMAILPGRVLVIDNNPISTAYLLLRGTQGQLELADSGRDPVESAAEGAVEGFLNWSKEQLVALARKIESNEIGFVEDKPTAEAIRKQEKHPSSNYPRTSS